MNDGRSLETPTTETASSAPLLGIELVARFEARLRRQDYSPRTIANYTWVARKLVAAFPAIAPQYLGAEHVAQFLDGAMQSPRTYAITLSRLKAFFHFLRRHERLIRSNPCDDVEKPRYRIRYKPAPTREHFEQICAACRTPDETLLIEVLYFTGLRISELRALQWKHLDVEKRRAYVAHGKGNKARTVVFPVHVARQLTAQMEVARRTAAPREPAECHIFASAWHAEAPRSVRVMQDAVRAIGRRAGLPYPLTPHILRHGFARLCKTSGMPLETTARLMGHADVRPVSAIYGRLDEDDLQRDYDRCVRGLGG